MLISAVNTLLACMWWWSYEGTACETLKTEDNGTLTVDKCKRYGSTHKIVVIQKPNQNPQLCLSWAKANSSHMPAVNALRWHCGGRIGIRKKEWCIFRMFCLLGKKKVNVWEKNATYCIKVGINGPSFDRSNCLAQGWHRGSKELGCSLLPIQMSHASKLSEELKLLCSAL